MAGWPPLLTANNITTFDDTDYSFDVRVNWTICEQFVTEAPLVAHIVDYALVLSAVLRLLH